VQLEPWLRSPLGSLSGTRLDHSEVRAPVFGGCFGFWMAERGRVWDPEPSAYTCGVGRRESNFWTWAGGAGREQDGEKIRPASSLAGITKGAAAGAEREKKREIQNTTGTNQHESRPSFRLDPSDAVIGAGFGASAGFQVPRARQCPEDAIKSLNFWNGSALSWQHARQKL
jgi:hypothetical protein